MTKLSNSSARHDSSARVVMQAVFDTNDGDGFLLGRRGYRG